MKCKYCNEPVEPQFSFCEACGKPLVEDANRANTTSDGVLCKCGGSRFDSDGYCEACGYKPSSLDVTDIRELGKTAASASHRGRHHAENQDAVAMLELPEGTALALADGVSTSCHARQAADLAVHTALNTLKDNSTVPPRDRIALAIRCAHEAVCQLDYDDPILAEPQATLVLAIVESEVVWYGWIGDSRLYLLDQIEATQLTVDDSWLNEQLMSGVPILEAQKDANAHCIVQCLGMRDDQIDIHIGSQALAADTNLLLCSDGLWNYCEQTQVLWALWNQFQHEPQLARQCERMIEFANKAGGQDNITVALYNHQHRQAGS